ncbi:MAG: BlaI/MecI/CopY family transcriptional regulator [Deltaproteobacteria bacterium]|nr:BlaI/MecI/CopY family transcriptional regulator [Deltaproteobacteria bacterium]
MTIVHKKKSTVIKSIQTEKLLTETELELMNILWKLGEGSVSDVQQELALQRDLAYTSISTILRILEQKGVVKTRKEGRGHVYIPAIKKQDYESKTVKHMVEKVFSGAPTALVRQLLDSVSQKELDEIKAMIKEKSGVS